MQDKDSSGTNEEVASGKRQLVSSLLGGVCRTRWLRLLGTIHAAEAPLLAASLGG